MVVLAASVYLFAYDVTVNGKEVGGVVIVYVSELTCTVYRYQQSVQKEEDCEIQ